MAYKSIYFKQEECRRCTPPCNISDLSDELLERLDYARSLLGSPIRLTSAYRSEDYEISKGRSGSSSHCKGLAVDIYCNSDFFRLELVKQLLRAGFRRIGIAKTFIHVDIDTRKPICLWLYE